MLLTDDPDAAGKSLAVGKQGYSEDGNKVGDDADTDVGRFMSLGETETRATFPISL